MSATRSHIDHTLLGNYCPTCGQAVHGALRAENEQLRAAIRFAIQTDGARINRTALDWLLIALKENAQ